MNEVICSRYYLFHLKKGIHISKWCMRVFFFRLQERWSSVWGLLSEQAISYLRSCTWSTWISVQNWIILYVEELWSLKLEVPCHCVYVSTCLTSCTLGWIESIGVLCVLISAQGSWISLFRLTFCFLWVQRRCKLMIQGTWTCWSLLIWISNVKLVI